MQIVVGREEDLVGEQQYARGPKLDKSGSDLEPAGTSNLAQRLGILTCIPTTLIDVDVRVQHLQNAARFGYHVSHTCEISGLRTYRPGV